MERGLPPLLATRSDRIAQTLAALGSEQRLTLLRALIAKPRSAQELQAALGATSPGPLYHHLKELVALGLVEQPERSEYRIRARYVVPLLAIVSAALDIATKRRDEDE